MKKFELHGDFTLSVEGNILISLVRGPFNVECTRAYLRELTPVAQTLAAAGSWAGITEYSVSALFPLDSSVIMRKNMEIAVKHLKLVANCWVVPPTVEGYGIVYNQARHVFDGILPFEVFESSADARAWTRRQLAPHLSSTATGMARSDAVKHPE
ncbi:MAG: hypothetical protein V4634_00365 [Pseudomonadota bacterium]